MLRSLGVPLDKADDYLLCLIQKLITECEKICTPKAACTLFSKPAFDPDKGTMLLNNESFFLNNIVLNALSESLEIAVFIGTCGFEVEKFSKQLMLNTQTLEGYIVDLIGSEIAEGMADYIHKRVALEFEAQGSHSSNRFSPGYCKWPVADQQLLFRLMNTNNCGVQLTPSSLMIPVKSVSGIIGLGNKVQNSGYSCNICKEEYCLYREKRQQPNLFKA